MRILLASAFLLLLVRESRGGSDAWGGQLSGGEKSRREMNKRFNSDRHLATSGDQTTNSIVESVLESSVDIYKAVGTTVSDDRSATSRSEGTRDGAEPTRTKREAVATSPYSAKRRMARSKFGDINVGALFPVHQQPPIQTAYSRVCGAIREYYGIQRIETFIMTVEKINRDPRLLPNITLGWDIRDSCWYSAIALEQSIDFIRDAIASKTIRDGQLVSTHDSSSSQPSKAKTVSGAGSGRTKAGFDPSVEDRCGSGLNKPIVGLIGPGSSEATIQVQNLMQIFNIPQIGYSATSIDLSDKNVYKYFLRVVPPDNYQVQVLVDLVLAFNWTYISTVHSDGNYGLRGMEMFTDLARNFNVCIASSDSVASSDSDLEFGRVVETLKKTPKSTVVICFCEGITVQKLLKALKDKKVDGKFLIIGSDGWGNRLDVVRGQEETAAGGISVKLHSPPYPGFDEHYASLKPNKTTSERNPWFNEFWQQKFKCYLPGEERNTAFQTPCTGNESLHGSDQDSKLSFVANAVETMARALDDMHRDLCGGKPGLCPRMTPVNGTLFLEYLLNVSFVSYSGQDIHFDINGDPPGYYEILNYQPYYTTDNNLTYKYVTIGRWTMGNLELNESAIYWPGKDHTKAFRSACSEPCKVGFVKEGVGSDGITCCWVCVPCKENEIVVDEAHCQACDLGWWPNSQQTECLLIPVDFVTWHHTGSVVVMALACVGLFFTAWVAGIFIRSHDTPVVKASTRELSYILLIGIALAFSCNFLLVAKPGRVFCYMSRIVPGLAFSLMYGALVTRTNRIARILEGSKRIMTKKPRFMSATAQVVITGIIIGVECVIITTMLVVEPADSMMDYSVARRVKLVCNTSSLGIIVPLGFDLFLIFMCTLYAVKTRNLPENFNEAKFIGFTMYTTCVIWLGFFPIYFGGENKEVTMSISISLSAAIALLLLFFPKVYIILWAPEKNTRGAFTTSKDVRCHIGSKSVPSSDSMEFREGKYEIIRPDGKVSKAWRQKSLDEKKLRFVMKRSSMPLQASDASYVNHGVLTNHKTPSGSRCKYDAKSGSRKADTGAKSMPGAYLDDFSDFECLLDEDGYKQMARRESKEAEDDFVIDIGSKNCACQTGDELIEALFSQLRRRRQGERSESDRGSMSSLNLQKPPDPVKVVTFSPHVPLSMDDSWQDTPKRSTLREDAFHLERNYDNRCLRSVVEVEKVDSGLERVPYPRPLIGYGDELDSLEGFVQGAVGEDRYTSDATPSGSTRNHSHQHPHPHHHHHHHHQHHHHNSIYHRPPTPRTPHKHVIVSGSELAGSEHLPGGPSSLSWDGPSSSVSSHPLHMQAQQGVARAEDCVSSNSNSSSRTSRTSRSSSNSSMSEGSPCSSAKSDQVAASQDDALIPLDVSVKSAVLADDGVARLRQYLLDSSIQTSEV